MDLAPILNPPVAFTPATIAIEEEGKIVSITCKFDGYPAGIGNILRMYWHKDKITPLIKMGDIISLGREIGEKHHPESYKGSDNWTIVRGRDAEEIDPRIINPVYHTNVESWLAYRKEHSGCLYGYLWNDVGHWEHFTI